MESFYSREIWRKLNSDLASHMKLDSGRNLYLFKDAFQALFETVLGLKNQYPNKKRMGLIKSPSPYWEPLINVLYGLGLEISILDEELLSKPSLLKQKVDEESYLVMILAYDIPFFSYLNFNEELSKLLIDLRCPQIVLHHESHRVCGISQLSNPFQVHIYDYLDISCLIKGPRILFEVPIAENLNWTDFKFSEIVDDFAKRDEDRKLVLDFENQFGSTQWNLMNSNQRTFDRALIYLEDVSAWALIEYLSQKDELFCKMETPSLIKWQGMKTMNWFTSTRVNVPDLRYLLVIPLEILRWKSFKTDFQDAVNEIRKLQGT